MNSSLFSLFHDGQRYMKLWPKDKALNSLLPEGRVISATDLAIKVMPPLAVLASASLVQIHGLNYLPQAIAVAAFFLTLPMQGMLWLGHRSNQLLPPNLKAWYKEVHATLVAHGCRLDSVKKSPRYVELAAMLKTAFSEMDKAFTRQLL
jgi:uncharacterized membrane protein YfbV (UPF0208 family)